MWCYTSFMFKPQYILTEPLINTLTQIERLYGQIEGLRLPKELELNIERNNLIQSAYVSNSIEGNPLSLPEVTNLLLGDRVPVNRDEKEVRNYFDILKTLYSYTKQPLSLETTLSLHRRLLTGVKDEIAGSIRNKPIVVGSYRYQEGTRQLHVQHNPPFHTQGDIRHALDELSEWTKQSTLPIPLKAGIFHHQFVYIHPFEDGNGRNCRLLTALIFLQGNYLINKYFVLDDYYYIDRLQYSEKLHTADSGDKTEWSIYFTEGVKYSLEAALAKAHNALTTLSVSNQPTPREKVVLALFQNFNELSSSMVAEKLQVTRQQAHKLLQSLVERGLIEKRGSTKSSYYLLK